MMADAQMKARRQSMIVVLAELVAVLWPSMDHLVSIVMHCSLRSVGSAVMLGSRMVAMPIPGDLHRCSVVCGLFVAAYCMAEVVESWCEVVQVSRLQVLVVFEDMRCLGEALLGPRHRTEQAHCAVVPHSQEWPLLVDIAALKLPSALLQKNSHWNINTLRIRRIKSLGILLRSILWRIITTISMLWWATIAPILLWRRLSHRGLQQALVVSACLDELLVQLCKVI